MPLADAVLESRSLFVVCAARGWRCQGSVHLVAPHRLECVRRTDPGGEQSYPPPDPSGRPLALSSAQSERAAVCQSTSTPSPMLPLYRMDNPAYSLAARQLPTAHRGAISGESARCQWRCKFSRSCFFVHGSRLYEMPHSCSRCMYASASASASASAGHQLSIFRTQLIQCRDNSHPLCAVSPRPSTHGAMRWMIV